MGRALPCPAPGERAAAARCVRGAAAYVLCLPPGAPPGAPSSLTSSPPLLLRPLFFLPPLFPSLPSPPPRPGLLLCGCWRLLVVTGECVCAPGPGGSVCISHRCLGGGVGGPQGRACLVPSPLFSSSLLPSGQVSDSAVQEVFWRSSIKWPL